MEPSTSFADMGVDSLMSIAIVSAVKREIVVELPGSFFQEHPTMGDVTNESRTTDEISSSICGLQSPPLSVHNDNDLVQSPNIPALFERLGSKYEAKIDETVSDPVNIEFCQRKTIQSSINLSAFNSWWVLVQECANYKAEPLFLIVDGAGSAAAYIHLPLLPSGGQIYALESPFLSDPSKFTCSVGEVARIYLIAIWQAQLKGPYALGGWSACAVYVYEVARQLLN